MLELVHAVLLGAHSVTEASHQGGRKASYWRTTFRLALDQIAAIAGLATKQARCPPVPERHAPAGRSEMLAMLRAVAP